MAEYGVATISVLMPHCRLRPRAADPPRPWNTAQPSPTRATHIGKRLAGKLHEPFERAGGGRAINPTSPDSTPLKPGNAGGGKGPQFKTNARRGEEPGDWATEQLRNVFRNCRRRYTRKRRRKLAIASTPCTTRSAVRISWRMPMPSAVP